MRVLLLLIPAIVLAQTPAAKSTSPAAATKAKAGTAKAATAKSATTKSATAKSATTKAAAPATLTTDEQKEVYALGLSISETLKRFDLSPAELELVKKAMTDAEAGKPAEKLDDWGPKITGLARERATRVTGKEKVAAQAFMAKAASEPGAVKTASGLIYREEQAGTGPMPSATDTVKVNYRGTLRDGTEFDSSYKRNMPATFPLNQVIKCWTEGLQKMKVGGKSQLVCPSDLAYGDGGQQGIPGGAALIFEVELLEIMPANNK